MDSVIDGDSVWFWIDLDFDGLWAHRNCRLIGIDAPDKNPAKLESCNWLKGLLPPHQKVSLFVPGLDKYGRPLVGVYLDDNETSLNLQSLALGLSVPYQGGAR